MTVATSDRPELTGNAATDVAALRRLHRELAGRVTAATNVTELLDAVADLFDRYAPPIAMYYAQRDDQGDLTKALRLRPSEDDDRLRRQVLSACQAACQTGEIHLRQQVSPDQTIVAAPIALRGHAPNALGVICTSGASVVVPDDVDAAGRQSACALARGFERPRPLCRRPGCGGHLSN